MRYVRLGCSVSPSSGGANIVIRHSVAGAQHRPSDRYVAPFAFGISFFFVVLFGFAWLAQPPTTDAAAELIAPANLLVYEASRTRPRVLAGTGDTVVYDRPRLDWSPLADGRRPTWRFSGYGYTLSAERMAGEPLLLRCAGDSATTCDGASDLVGRVPNNEVTGIQVAIDGEWREYANLGDLFVVPIGPGQVAGDLRWLDADHRVVGAVDRNWDGRISADGGDPRAVRSLQARRDQA
jgi:hypothetical protein